MAENEINSQTFLEMRAVNVARGDRVVLHDATGAVTAIDEEQRLESFLDGELSSAEHG